MNLLIKSFVFGFTTMAVLIFILTNIGNHVSGSGVLTLGMMAFLSPSIYALGELYEKSKKQ